MKRSSLGLNAVLSGIKTICSVIFPLITFPYAARVLHVNNMGVYNFCASIISYFTLFAGLGINTYAIREGARYRDDKLKMSRFASEIFSINLLSTIIAYAALFICIATFPILRDDAEILLMLSISILFTTIGCEWIFNIYEDFAYITIRSIAFQFVSLFLMFALVKDESDLMQYAAVTVIASAGANIFNAFARRKYCKIKFIFKTSMLPHMAPILVLFANSIATTLYINSDVTMLGIFADDYHTGLYSVSTKVYTMVKTVLGALIVVSIPRLSAYLGRNDSRQFSAMANKILNTLLVILIPAIIGLFLLSKSIILILSGEEYIEATSSLQILSIALLFSIFSWFYTSCILVPNRQESKVLVATIAAAIVNIVLNFVIIPLWQQNAVALSTCMAEFVSAVICFWFGRNYFHSNVSLKDTVSILIGCAGIVGICLFIFTFVGSILLSTLAAILGSVLIYGILLILFKNSVVVALFNIIIKKIKK